MIIRNKDIKKFIKEFYDEHNNEFVFRIRKDKNIVYYNGLRAFTINKHYKKHIKLSLFEKTFKCNPTAISEYCQNIDEYKSNLQNMCTDPTAVAKICNFVMKKITFEISGKFDVSEIDSHLDEFCKKYNNLFDSDKLKNIVNNEIKRIETESVLNNKEIKEIKRKKLELEFTTPLTNAKEIIEIQFDFLKDMIINNKCILTNTIKSIGFDYKIYSKEKYNKNCTKDEIDIFISSVKKAIDNYKGHDELEKKYQHQFMLSDNTKKLFGKIDDNKKVYPFEEEYYIIEDFSKSYFKKMDGNGRIDAIYIGEKDGKVTDIYLIELKVNENVVGGNNGIHKHLDNIKDLFSEDNEKGRKLFFKTMIERYENRNKLLIDKNYTVENKYSLSDITYHFYTVIGFSDMPKIIKGKKEIIPGYSKKSPSHYDITIELLTKFKEKNYSSLSQNELPEKYRKEDMSILKIVKDIKNCCVELIFDINNWDKTTYNPDYNHVTDEYFKK